MGSVPGRAFACDLGAACTGFLSGLALASGQIESGRADRALVIGADLCSRATDRADRKTAGLFGDGAGAVVLGAGEGGPVGRTLLRSDARQAECIVADHGDRLIRMQGQDTFRAAVDALSEVTEEILRRRARDRRHRPLRLPSGQRPDHASRRRAARAAAGAGRGLHRDIGNTSAATLPLALHHAASEGRLAPGDRVLLAAFGAGFTWGAGLLTWGGEVSR